MGNTSRRSSCTSSASATTSWTATTASPPPACSTPVEIDAEVTEFVPLADPEAARTFAERRAFERSTGLQEVGAAHPESYSRLSAMIEAFQREQDIPDYRDAARRWYGQVYRPLWHRVRERRLTRYFPGDRSADFVARLGAWRAETEADAPPRRWTAPPRPITDSTLRSVARALLERSPGPVRRDPSGRGEGIGVEARSPLPPPLPSGSGVQVIQQQPIDQVRALRWTQWPASAIRSTRTPGTQPSRSSVSAGTSATSCTPQISSVGAVDRPQPRPSLRGGRQQCPVVRQLARAAPAAASPAGTRRDRPPRSPRSRVEPRKLGDAARVSPRQQPLGQPAHLKQRDVPRTQPLDRVAAPAHAGTRPGAAHSGSPADPPPRVEDRRAPGDHPAPIVAHHVRPLRPERPDQRRHVARQRLRVVPRGRLVALRL